MKTKRYKQWAYHLLDLPLEPYVTTKEGLPLSDPKTVLSWTIFERVARSSQSTTQYGVWTQPRTISCSRAAFSINYCNNPQLCASDSSTSFTTLNKWNFAKAWATSLIKSGQSFQGVSLKSKHPHFCSSYFRSPKDSVWVNLSRTASPTTIWLLTAISRWFAY